MKPAVKEVSPAKLSADIAASLSALPVPSTPNARSIRRSYSRRLSTSSPDLVIQIASDLADRPGPACRFVAYELITHHPTAFSHLTLDQLLALGHHLDSWSAVDTFACILSGPAWRDGLLPDSIMDSWTVSPDRWLRRTALVSTIALSRRGSKADIRQCLKVCRQLVSDRDDMVVKALSWALRELAKKHPERAQQFLNHHKRTLAPRVVCEVESKISTGVKNPRR